MADILAAPIRNLNNMRRLTRFSTKEQDSTRSGMNPSEDMIWALKNISCQVHPGEVVGIIGRNGAGKSTLLKILSRITEPTSGEVKLHGRVASLLEVGTGFHPELTGRENIYLNGTILGMRKAEINRKFDEIVAFSEIERFLDTPVKRYSSGMYVRLAFAVAAHLESEILLVDEVLAVGDAAFQKKCLGKMNELSSQEGRTILFISHNMPAVVKFCSRGILISAGEIEQDDKIQKVVNNYLELGSRTKSSTTWKTQDRPGNESLNIAAVTLLTKEGKESSIFNLTDELHIRITFEVTTNKTSPQFSLMLFDMDGNSVFSSLNNQSPDYGSNLTKGTYYSTCIIPGNLLNSGRYNISISGFINHWNDGFRTENVASFDAVDDGVLKGDYHGEYSGSLRPLLSWSTNKL